MEGGIFLRHKLSKEEILNAIKDYHTGKYSYTQIAERYNVSGESLRVWINNYDAIGGEAFSQTGNNRYSKELKEQAVRDYLSGEASLLKICNKYKIKSKTQLQNWIEKYNNHEELKASGTGGTAIMTTGRKTSFEERIEIVEYCIAHDHNYADTAEKYKISYQQARNYTVKYESSGVDALQDRRGKRKTEDMMSELERLRAEVKLLKAEKKRAEMEASFLKKLDEIERRRG